jgi:hypothetical protein
MTESERSDRDCAALALADAQRAARDTDTAEELNASAQFWGGVVWGYLIGFAAAALCGLVIALSAPRLTPPTVPTVTVTAPDAGRFLPHDSTDLARLP